MNMKLHPLTLKFYRESSHLEEPFLKDYYQVSVSQIRIFLILGAMFYVAFGALDALLMPQQKFMVWLVRFIVVGPALIGVLLISFSSIFEVFKSAFPVPGLKDMVPVIKMNKNLFRKHYFPEPFQLHCSFK